MCFLASVEGILPPQAVREREQSVFIKDTDFGIILPFGRNSFAMKLCYNRLWKLLIDRGMTRTQMRLAAGISSSTLAKLAKGEPVLTSVLVRICATLKCDLSDIVELVLDER